ncbi:DUF6265 family protein [Spongiivirga citrea]|uniref:DUF6265 domain-containing protein n=1 Tax=Spongiivirga citrea TaxID=1481457 RepID=A0A6M0CMR9_9FLAO|nr:DUF6265 family protein [Spongiivirga citrea]NER18952.1 hypothetical protein [Spongiivirga citrea]
MKKTLCITLLFLIGISCNAQKTLQLKEGEVSPKATLNEVSWITGHWRCEVFGGIAEEIWSPPLGNSMMFSFKLVNDNAISFYEIGHIQQKGETLILQLKHFHGDLKGWEVKDKTVDFKLVKMDENSVYFEGLTFEKVDENAINVYVMVSNEDGKAEEVAFEYKRFK